MRSSTAALRRLFSSSQPVVLRSRGFALRYLLGRRPRSPPLRACSKSLKGADMSPLSQPKNYAARMGRWSAAHWKTATFGWLGFVVVAFALSSMVGVKNIDPNKTGPGQSGRMDKILNEGFKHPATENV